MNAEAQAFHLHAEAVLHHELRRARARLGTLPYDRRLEVEQLTGRVTAALVESVLEQACTEPSLAQALHAIYGVEVAWELKAVPCAAD